MIGMRGVVACALGVLAAGCGGADTADQVPPDTPPAGAPAAMPAMPDTTAAGVWAHLEDAEYRTWARWPGKGELYAGVEPHGMLLTTYVNALARDALTNGSMMMPNGAVVVKENYMPDSTLAAVTVMYKRAGFDATGNDWFWAKYDAAGVVEVSGRVDMCKACHSARADADYLMTPRQ